MAKYKLTEQGAIDTEKGACIPNDLGNIDWQDYLAWASENTAGIK